MIAVMGTIFFLSHQPGKDMQIMMIPGFDKLAHAGIYALLAATALFALPKKIRESKPVLTGIMIVFFCLLYGSSDEFHQSFIPGRESSMGDLVADGIGSAILVLVWICFVRTDPE